MSNSPGGDDPGEAWLTVAEAAALSGDTEAAWRARIRRARVAARTGRRPGVQVLRRGDGLVFVARADVERIARLRRSFHLETGGDTPA